MARYIFVDHRPGINFATPAGNVRSSEEDGAAELSAEQVAFFKRTDVKLELVDAGFANTKPRALSASEKKSARAAQQTIADNAADAAKIASETSRVPVPQEE